jgi:hypothetical protein
MPGTSAAAPELAAAERPSSAIAATRDRPRPRNATSAASNRKKTSQESVLLDRSMATPIGMIASIRAAISAALRPKGWRTNRYSSATEATPASACGT